MHQNLPLKAHFLLPLHCLRSVRPYSTSARSMVAQTYKERREVVTSLLVMLCITREKQQPWFIDLLNSTERLG